MRIQRALATAALIFASVGTARATTTYSSQGSLEGGNLDLTFQTADFTGVVCVSCTSFTVGGITFASSSTLTKIDNATVRQNGAGAVLTVTLPSTVVAFGAQMNAPHGATLVAVTFTGGDSGGSLGLPAYFGARVTSGSITPVTYTINFSDAVDLVNFETGSSAQSSVPETGTLLSIATGLLLFGLGRRRARFSPRGA
jgi:hypothetical protein